MLARAEDLANPYPDAPPQAANAPRRFLLITLPYGRFGRLLNAALRARGADVRHMVFNAGDLVDRRGPGAVVFRGSLQEWRSGFAELTTPFTDLVVYGETRPYTHPALERASRAGHRVWVLDQGYFRPDWVTVDRGGANAASSLPRRPEAYAEPMPAPEPERVGPVTRHLALAIGRYYGAEALARSYFPRHVLPFAASPVRQGFAHVGRYLRLRWRREPTAASIRAEGPFFLACLQREGDSQLTRHSPLRTNEAFLDLVMASFAAAAPRRAQLVIKNHPLESGVIDLEALASGLAQRHGLADRVRFLEGGVLAALCRASEGLVVNNSTAALAAMGFGTPVKVLGRAFFDVEGLTDGQTLDAFWRGPRAPDPALFERFRANVIARTQVNGSFEGPRLIRQTADRVADRLMAG